jgi:hypothetical protein
MRYHDAGESLLPGEGEEQIGPAPVSHDHPAWLAHRHRADGVDIGPQRVHHTFYVKRMEGSRREEWEEKLDETLSNRRVMRSEQELS